MSATADQLYREIQAQATRSAVLQDVLDELRHRGVTDSVALAAVRAMRNTADRREREARAKYLPLVQAAFQGSR